MSEHSSNSESSSDEGDSRGRATEKVVNKRKRTHSLSGDENRSGNPGQTPASGHGGDADKNDDSSSQAPACRHGEDSEADQGQTPASGHGGDKKASKKYKISVESSDSEDSEEWKLPDDLLAHFSKNVFNHKDKKKRKALLTKYECVRPQNITKAPKLDASIASVLKKKGSNTSVVIDKEWVSLFEEVTEVMGPLGKAWLSIENYIRDPDDDNEINIDLMGNQIRLAVTMLGQLGNTVIHRRRSNIVKELAGSDKALADSMLKDNHDALQGDHDNSLFGDDFEKNIKANTKGSKSLEEFMDFHKESKKAAAAASKPNAQPFRRGPTSGRGRGNYNHRGGARGRGQPSSKPFSKPGGKKSHRSSPFTVPTGAKNFRGSQRGKNKIVHKQLEEAVQGPSGLGHGKRFPNTAGGMPQSTVKTSSHKHDHTRKRCNLKRGGKHAFKRGSSKSEPHPRGIPKQCVRKGKKGTKQVQDDPELEEVKQISVVPTFQNGQPEGCKTSSTRERLPSEDRSQGCLLVGSLTHSIPETYEIRVDGCPIRVFDPGFRSGSCPVGVHKIAQSPNYHLEEIGVEDVDLHRRHADCLSDPRGSNPSSRFPDLHSGESGFNSELGKINASPFTGLRFPGYDNRHKVNDNLSSGRESITCDKSLQRDTVKSSVDFERFKQSVGEAGSYCTRGNPSSTSIEVASTGVDTSSKERDVIFRHSPPLGELVERALLVDTKSEITQGQTLETPGPSNGDLQRCCEKPGLGCCHGRGTLNRGVLVQVRKGNVPHQCVGIDGCRTSPKMFLETATSDSGPYVHRQSDSSVLSSENGRHKEQNVEPNRKEDLGFFAGKRNHTYSKLDSFQGKLPSRPRITEESELRRLAPLPFCVPNTKPEVGYPNSGLLCIQSDEATPTVHELASGPREPGIECVLPGLVSGFPLSLPSFQSDRSDIEEGPDGQSRKGHSGGSTLAGPVLVSHSIVDVHRPSKGNPEPMGPSDERRRTTTSIGGKPNPAAGGVAHLRESYASKGFSEQVVSLLVASKRSSTTKVYKPNWIRWSTWCDERKADPFTCPLSLVLEYLAMLFAEGLQYRTIAVHRSTISAYHAPIDGVAVGSHPEVTLLMKGVGNNRPPTPRYCVVWDVDKVLALFKRLDSDQNLDLALLTKKTAMLLALVSLARCSELHYLDLQWFASSESKMVFYFGKLPKNCRKKGLAPKPLEVFASDTCICPVKTAQCYIERTKSLRGETSQLFIGTVKPHKAVTSQTISRWIRDVLDLVGVDTSVFKGHSTRSASSSKVFSKGASISDIMSRGNWSNQCTWQKFYNKSIVSANARFQSKLFSV